MSCAVVQHVKASGSLVSSLTTGALSTTTGNLQHVNIGFFSGTGIQITAFGDTAGNTFPATQAVLTANQNTTIQAYIASATGNAANQWTLSLDGASYPTFDVIEISGQAVTPLEAVGQTNDALGTSHSVSTSGSTTTANGIACAMITTNSVAITAWTCDASFVEQSNQSNDATKTPLETATMIYSANGVKTFAPTSAPTGGCNLMITTYAALTGGGGTTYPGWRSPYGWH